MKVNKYLAAGSSWDYRPYYINPLSWFYINCLVIYAYKTLAKFFQLEKSFIKKAVRGCNKKLFDPLWFRFLFVSDSFFLAYNNS